MNSLDHAIVDISLALLPEQQVLTTALSQGASWLEAGHFLRVDIDGNLDPARLQAALDHCWQRHDALRSRFLPVPGYHGVRQVVVNDGAVPLTSVVESGTHEQREQRLAQWHGAPWSIVDGQPFQALLQRTAPARWQLILGVARSVADRATLGIVFDALLAAYRQAPAEEMEAQFTQYLQWHGEVTRDDDAPAAERYWQALFNEDLAQPDLPERHASARVSEGRSRRLTAVIPPALVTELQRLAERHGHPIEHLLQATWWLLMGRVSGVDSFLGGWRHDARQDYDYFAGVAGLFERTLPVRVLIDAEQPFSAWFDGLAGQLQEHGPWQEYWSVQPGRERVLPRYGFAAQRSIASGNTQDARWLPANVLSDASFELLLTVLTDVDGQPRSLALDYLPARHGESAMRQLLVQYTQLLHGVAAQPDLALGTLSLLGAEERSRLLSINHEQPTLAAHETLAGRLAHWAAETPDALALSSTERQLTWAQVGEQARDLSALLAHEGAAPGTVVALNVPRSLEQVIAILAVWQTGAAYLPLDPQWPAARRTRIVEQAGALLVVGQADEPSAIATWGFEQAVQAGRALPSVEPVAQLTDAAYVLFTSGSTGTPKGVVVEHRHLLNYTAAISTTLGLADHRHFALSSTVAADLGNTALFGALYNGATLHLADDATLQAPEAFAAYVREQRIDVLKITPSHLSALLETDSPALPRTVVLGGEALPPSLVKRILDIRPDCRLFNHYGPTETTVGVLVHAVSRADALNDWVPLTQVLPGNQVYVLDQAQRLVSAGEPGELYIGGRQVCRGYLDGSDEAFIRSPFVEGDRLYRTGDLARYLADGGIRLQGRRDLQVKIRGFRVEPGELEAALLSLPGVGEAAVIVHHREGAAELSAFVTATGDARDGWLDSLREGLAKELPAALLPSRLRQVANMPRLPNGKLDRAALDGVAPASVEPAFTAPRDALEELLATRMAQLLGVPQVSIHDDFFSVGGHSLLVIKLVAGIRKLLGCEVQPGAVFDSPTPAGLAALLRETETAPGQLETMARARLQIDRLSPEERARLMEQAQRMATQARD